MVDYENPKNWTRQYVSSHHIECLLFLRELNVGVLNHLESRQYFAAGAGIEMILNGLDALLKSGKTDGVRSCIASYSCVGAELCALADPVSIENEMRNMGLKRKYQGKDLIRYLRDTAIAGFKDAQDYAVSDGMRGYAASMERALRAGVSAERIRRDHAPDFPKDIQDILLSLDDRFFVSEIRKCAPNRCFVLDKSRLIFTNKLVGGASYTPASFGPVEMLGDSTCGSSELASECLSRPSTSPPSSKSSVSAPPRQGCFRKMTKNFDEWMEMNGWGEEELAWAYQRVKLRRNIYGVLLLVPMLGLLIMPFWLRAVFLTKAIHYRDLTVDFNLPTKIIIVLYGLPSLFIYPIAMGWIVSWSNWGMGLWDPRGRVLNFLFWGFILFLLIRSLVVGGIFEGLADKASALPSRIVSAISPNAKQTQIPAEKTLIAYASPQSVQIDGKKVTLEMYALKDASGSDIYYARLEDVAVGLRGTAAQFSVTNDGAIRVDTGEIYTMTGDEWWTPFSGDQTGLTKSVSVVVDGSPADMDAIILSDDEGREYTYFKFQDLSVALDFKMDWIAEQGFVIETGPAQSLSDKALLAKADIMVNEAFLASFAIGTAQIFDSDDNYTVTEEKEWGEETLYRVIGYNTIAEAEEAARDYWDSIYSRRMPSISDDDMEMMRYHLTELGGKLYRRPPGLGIGDFGCSVDQMISRTEDEAVFSAYLSGYEGDTPFQFSLVLEDGVWKYLELED